MLEIHNVNLEYNNSYFEDTQKYIKSLQQTEWDVEIELELIKSSIDGEAIWKLKLDTDGCLILKKI